MQQLTALDLIVPSLNQQAGVLASIVDGCPQLQSVILRPLGRSLQQPHALLPLLQLQSLTELWVPRMDDACVSDVLVQLTRLRALRASYVDTLTDQGLLQLTVNSPAAVDAAGLG